MSSYLLTCLCLALSLATACRPSVDDNEPVPISSNGVVGDGSITTTKLADSAVTTAKVADAAITPEKLSKAYLPLAGGTMTGALNMGGLSLTNLATPSASTDAVTKNYADSNVAGFGLDTSGIASISNGQALTWDSANSRWTPTTVVGGANATQIQGVNVDNTAPTANQAFFYNNGLSKWAAGTLPVAGGGTGAVTLTSNGILYGTGTTAVAALAAMNNGQLVVGRTGLAPLVATLSGDATIDNAGALTIANTSVTAAKIANGTITSTQVSATGGVSTYSAASKTANYTLTTSDGAVLCNAAGGGFTIALPAAATAGLAGKVFTIKKTDSSSNAVTIDPNGAETLDGATTVSLTAQYQSVDIASDGTNWSVLASRGAQLFPLAGTSYAHLTVQAATAAGWGTTKTMVARFTTTASAGADLTITQSATNGDSITVNTAGGYFVEAHLSINATSNVAFIITKNSSDAGTSDPLTNDVNGTILKAQFAPESNLANGGNGTSLSGIFTLSAADVLRAHGRGTTGVSTAFAYLGYFKVTRLW